MGVRPLVSVPPQCSFYPTKLGTRRGQFESLKPLNCNLLRHKTFVLQHWHIACGSRLRPHPRQLEPKEVSPVIRTMTKVLALSFALLALGCHEDKGVNTVDRPPHTVDSVYSVTGDGRVTVYWRANQENDIDYYKVYRNKAPTGTFTLVGSSSSTSFVDTGVTNGNTYYYAVSAVDLAGQESADLSFENVFDTPRPEGFGVTLTSSAA